jgi:hypothetical protein
MSAPGDPSISAAFGLPAVACPLFARVVVQAHPGNAKAGHGVVFIGILADQKRQNRRQAGFAGWRRPGPPRVGSGQFRPDM